MIIITEDWAAIENRAIDPFSTVESDNVNSVHMHMGASNMYYTGFDYKSKDGLYYFEIDETPALGLHLSAGTCVKDNVSISIQDSTIYLIYGNIPLSSVTKYVCIKYQYIKTTETPIASITAITKAEYEANPQLYFILYEFETGSRQDWVDETGIYHFPTIDKWIEWCNSGKWKDRRYETGPLFRNNDTANTCILCNETPTDPRHLTTKGYVDEAIGNAFDPNKFVRRTIEGSITEQTVEPKLKYKFAETLVPDHDEYITRAFADEKYLPLYLNDDKSNTIAVLNDNNVEFTNPVISAEPLETGSVHQLATLQYVADAIARKPVSDEYVKKSGDSMYGALYYEASERDLLNPDDHEYITKYYLDNTKDLPIASKYKVGCIKVGDNLEIDVDGRLNCLATAIPLADETHVGGIKTGRNVHVTSDGVAWVPVATPNIRGTVRSGGDIEVESNGVVHVIDKIATYSKLGSVVVDNDTLEIDAGGLLRVKNGGGGGGGYTLPIATNSTLGGVKIGSSISISSDGTINMGTVSIDNIAGLRTELNNKVSLDYSGKISTNILHVNEPNGVAGLDSTGKLSINVVPTGPGTGIPTLDPSTNKIPTSELPINVANGVAGLDANGKIANTLLYYGVSNGVATLDSTGRVPSAQLPSFVDDVIEGYYNSANGKFYKESTYTTEIPGEDGKIYISLDTNITYRWSGTVFVPIGSSLALGETHSTAYYGDFGKAAYDHSQLADGTNPHATTFANIIDNIATTEKLGGIKVGQNLNIDASGKLDAVDTTYSEATTTAAGLMSAADKTKLDGVAEGANKYELPAATATTLGGVKQGANISIAADGTISTDGGGYVLPTASADTLGGIKVGTRLTITDGVLSADDQSYTLPIASATVLGGVKQGNNITIAADGTLSGAYAEASTTAAGLMSAADKTKFDSIKTAKYIASSKTLVLNLNLTKE